MANPIISEKLFSAVWTSENSMTLNWTINKTLLLILFTIAWSIFSWMYFNILSPYILLAIPLNLVLWFIIIFFKKSSPYLSIIYAILEWLTLWVISTFFEKTYPWIVMQAVLITFAVFMFMLLSYRTWLIQVNQKYLMIISALTFSIFIVYMVSLIWSLSWWYQIPYIHSSWLIWIWFSVVVCIVAVLNLWIDFKNIELWVESQAPKYMEWYMSFWLLVTLIWVYLEILKLLSKLRSRD